MHAPSTKMYNFFNWMEIPRLEIFNFFKTMWVVGIASFLGFISDPINTIDLTLGLVTKMLGALTALGAFVHMVRSFKKRKKED